MTRSSRTPLVARRGATHTFGRVGTLLGGPRTYNCLMPVLPAELYATLTAGPAYSFALRLHETLPLACCGVYTIWRGDDFLYVGIGGRGLDMTIIHTKMRGIRDRLGSHQYGRRSGDQFAVYVSDRLVLPNLTPEEIIGIASAELSMDALTRVYIHENLTYRFCITDDYPQAMGIELEFTQGRTPVGKPLLNPNSGQRRSPQQV
jgi:hypothetical protein